MHPRSNVGVKSSCTDLEDQMRKYFTCKLSSKYQFLKVMKRFHLDSWTKWVKKDPVHPQFYCLDVVSKTRRDFELCNWPLEIKIKSKTADDLNQGKDTWNIFVFNFSTPFLTETFLRLQITNCENSNIWVFSRESSTIFAHLTNSLFNELNTVHRVLFRWTLRYANYGQTGKLIYFYFTHFIKTLVLFRDMAWRLYNAAWEGDTEYRAVICQCSILGRRTFAKAFKENCFKITLLAVHLIFEQERKLLHNFEILPESLIGNVIGQKTEVLSSQNKHIHNNTRRFAKT